MLTIMAPLCVALAAVHEVKASIVHASRVEGRYFKVFDSRSHDYEIAASWRWWLRVHRAIKSDPRLARRFGSKPLDLTKGQTVEFKNGTEKIRKLRLKVTEVNKQPAHVYTLHIASFRSQSSLRAFVNQHWIGKGLNQRKVYERTPKQLSFFTSGDSTTRNDAIYSNQRTIQERRFTRLCYGVYENLNDARADKRVLERFLDFQIGVLREQPTNAFIRRVCYEPVIESAPRKWQDWETDR